MLKFKIAASPLYKYGMAILFTAIAILISWLLWPVLYDAPFMFLLGAVALSAWRGGLAPGMLSAALAIVAADYYLIEPRYSVFTSLVDLLQFIVFSMIAFLISSLEESRNRSEDSLREVKDELAIILQSVADGITVQDSEGKPVFANAAAANLLGYPSIESVIGVPITELQNKYQMFDETGDPITYSVLPRFDVFKTGKTSTKTFKMRMNDTGEERWLQLTSSPIFDKKGNVQLAVNVFRDISEQVHDDQNQARLVAIVESTDDAIISKDINGTILSWNPGAERLYGYQASEAIGQPISILFPEAIKQRETHLIMRVSEGERIRHYETKRLHKNGALIDISLTISPIRNANGQIEGYAGIERDITHRKNREAIISRLRAESENQRRRLEAVIANIPGIVFVGGGDVSLDDEGAARFVSGYAKTMLGYEPDEFDSLLDFWKSVVHPDDWESGLAASSKVFQTGEPGWWPLRCITKDGKTVHAESYASVLKDHSGETIGICGVVMDVSVQKEAQDKLRQNTMLLESLNQRLLNLVSNVPGIVYESTINIDTNEQQFNFMSDYVEKILGYPADKWKQNPRFWEELIPPQDLEEALADATVAYEEGKPGKTQFRSIASDGSIRSLEGYFHFIPKDNIIKSYGVIMDITERKLIEDAITQYTEDLRRSNEELEQFAYVASHDLQEPLRMVTSYLQLIEQRYAEDLDEDAKEFIDFAVDGATRMKALINDLLAYSRVQRSAAEFTQVDMQQVIETVIYNLKMTIEDTKGQITYDDLPEVTANEGQMVQLFQNLLSNALKFRGQRSPKIHIGLQKDDTYWQFCIRDNGIGIEPEYLERIFVIFQRLHTRQDYPGTGIGLAICRKIVDKHHGKIWVESQPGAGTTFYFTIPIERRKRIEINGSS